MAVKSLTSVVNGSFLNRFGNLAQSQSGSKGSSAAAVLAAGLQTAARTYGTAVQGLNGVATYLNVSRGVLSKLGDLTDQMIDLADKASRGGIGSQKRANYDSQLKDLASQFTSIVKKTKSGGYNALKLEDIESVFVTMGLDPSRVESVKKIFSFFQELEDSADRKSLAADTSHAKRPIKIPSGAYSQQVVTTSGTATYTSLSSTNVGASDIDAIRTGDINGDGFQDIVSGHGTTISIQLGNGDGTFQAAQDYAGTNSTTTMQLTQLAGDGLYDVVMNSSDPDMIAVFSGAAGGTLNAAVEYQTNLGGLGATAAGITTGDFDGDLIADILVGTQGTDFSLLKGNADGTFAAGVTFSTTAVSADQIVSGDFDGDGDRDFAAYSDNFQIETFLNDGSGNFSSGSIIAPGVGGGQLVYADINSDGRGDLIASDQNGVNLVAYTGNPDGSFTSSDTIAALVKPKQLAVADLNNDGYNDVVFTDDVAFGVALGNNDGTFQAATYTTKNFAGNAIGAADFNGDGVIDVVAGENGGDIEYFVGGKEYSSTIQENVLGKPREFTDLFDERRHIRRRPEAYQMLADLKALKEQITTNLDAADKVGKFLSENISLVRAAGFAFLAASSDSRLSSITDAEQLAGEVRAKIRANPGVALSQASNLEAITVASLVLDSNSFPSLKNYKSILK